MKGFFVMLLVSLSAALLPEMMINLGATPQEGDKAPLMVAFADLKWTELPERKGMQLN